MNENQAKPIIPWIGGKRRLAKHILPIFPAHTCYVEPFAGAAALFFLKEPVKSEILNDINFDLTNLYRVAKHHLEELVHQFNYSLASRQMFEWMKRTPPEVLTDVQRAARFYYLQRLSFGGKVVGQVFGTSTTAPPKLRISDVRADLDKSWGRLVQATIETLPWADCVIRYDRAHTLFYFDPPYWGTEGYGVDFPLAEYDHIAELIRTMKGKAIVSVNDIPEMHTAFDGFNMKTVSVTYTVGKAGKRPDRKELIINNW